MISDIFFAVWFFLPAGLANAAPVFAAKSPWLRDFSHPIDGGKIWRGHMIFGPHKTWRGIIAGIVAGLLAMALQKFAYGNYAWAYDISNGLDYSSLPVILGGLMGFGALSGDAIKSFFKRRYGRKAGISWFPYDQLDYIIGGLLASLIFVSLELRQYLWIFVIWFGLHLIFSYLGYRLRLKAKPI